MNAFSFQGIPGPPGKPGLPGKRGARVSFIGVSHAPSSTFKLQSITLTKEFSGVHVLFLFLFLINHLYMYVLISVLLCLFM